MMKPSLYFAAMWLGFTAAQALAAGTKFQEGNTTLSGSEFHYIIFLHETDAEQQRHIEVQHLEEKYEGDLGEMSFRDRHLQIFEMVAKLIKASCSDGVSSLGNITVSKDPEQDEDPDASHPLYFTWEYSCK